MISGSDNPGSPQATYLAQNFPNPFNPMTRIEFGLREPARISLRIFDAGGRLVRVLAEDSRPAGRYTAVWDGHDGSGNRVASGMYFYRLSAGAFVETKKLVLLR
jgi:flagellar hook assembly protein FlgD